MDNGLFFNYLLSIIYYPSSIIQTAMKELYNNIKNKAFDNQVRLSIMSMLMVNDWIDFSTFKEMLELSDGNLSSHLSALESENYIAVTKQFVGKRPKSSYSATETGKKAFSEYLNALDKLIKNTITD